MSLKFLLPLLFEIFRGDRSAPLSNESLLVLKKNFNKEISSLVFKLFAGVILTALVIMAISRLFSALHIYIEQFQNSPMIEVITFSLLTLIGIGLLVYVFLGDQLTFKKVEEKETPPPAFDIQNVIYKFIDGVSQGFEKNAPSKRNEPTTDQI